MVRWLAVYSSTLEHVCFFVGEGSTTIAEHVYFLVGEGSATIAYVVKFCLNGFCFIG